MNDEELPRVFTPKTLSQRWQCSERHVRNMIARGELDFFRLGGKLFRIRTTDVLTYEKENLVVKPTLMTEDELWEEIEALLKGRGNAPQVHDSLAIAERYYRRVDGLSLEQIRDVVREVGSSLGHKVT